MLNIYFGNMPDAIYNTEVYFQNVYDDEWITDDFAREVIKKVDKSEVLDSQAIKSPVLGIIAPERLSGGTKTLLLMKNMPQMVFNASTCGDNCAKWILDLAQKEEGKKQKVLINLRHLMDFGEGEFRIRIVNTGKIVHNMAEYVVEAGLCLRERG